MLKPKSHISSKENSREKLLELNNDLLYGAYKIIENTDKIILSVNEDFLVWSEKNLEKFIWLENHISILSLEELRKGKLKTIFWSNSPKNLPILLSWSVIELVKMKNPKWWFRYHTFTSLRDWASSDSFQRTWVAGRNIGWDLQEEIDREYSEESPFLLQVDWVWTLATPYRKNKDDAIKDLKTSVEYFLNNKYNLDRNNPEQAEFVKMFERSFRWKIKYEELWDILREVIRNNRIEFFENKELDSFPGLEKDMKHMEIIDDKWNRLSSWKYFIYYDKVNNTIEYRSLREIKIPEWLNTDRDWFHPNWRIFLESQNQNTKTHRLENLWKENLVPAMKYFANLLKNILQK